MFALQSVASPNLEKVALEAPQLRFAPRRPVPTRI
jgi:hypothetical protein